MSATAAQIRARRGALHSLDMLQHRPWTALWTSRVLVLLCGVAGAALGTRRHGWRIFDPTGSTLRLGGVGNALAGTADRWDAVHYLQIAEHGYQNAANTSFYPLYPLLIRALSAPFAGSAVAAGIAISLVAFVIAMRLLQRLATSLVGRETANTTIVLLCFAPLSFFFTAIYTESLFLALTLGALLAAERERWWLAALLAGADSITRVQGVIVIAPIVWMWWHAHGRSWKSAAWLALAPLPLLGYCIYLHIHGFGFFSSVANESSSYGRTLGGPLMVIGLALDTGIRGLIQTFEGVPPIAPSASLALSGPFFNFVELIYLIIGILTLVLAWRRLPRAYAIYATLLLAIALWTATPINPLRSFDRYLMTIFPLWIVAADWLRQRRLVPVTLLLGIVALTYYSCAVATWSFVA